jgi:MFS family permease
MHPALRTLRYPNFRMFYGGQFVSILGTWMQTVAMSWLVYRLSGSAFLLTLVAGAQQLPILFFAPVAGVWADRLDRRKVLIFTQSLAGVQATALAALVFSGYTQVWHLVVLSLVLGVINAFETATRQAFLLDLIGDKADLPNAIALNSMLFNSARFVGPPLAGLVLALLGEAWCFAINAISFIGIVFAYVRIRVPAQRVISNPKHWLTDLTEGLRYAFGFIATRNLLIMLTVLSVGTASWQPLMPILAAQTFAGDARTLGMMIGAVGLGALVGTVFLAFRMDLRGMGKIIATASTLTGIALGCFALSHLWWLSLGLLAVFGGALITTVASCNTVLQSIAREDMRGRVVSLYVMSFLGMSPIGNFLGGALAEAVGVHYGLLICAIVVCAASLWFTRKLPAWREAVRITRAQQKVVTRVLRENAEQGLR